MEFYDKNLDISFKNDLKHKGINASVDAPIPELPVFHRFATENDIKDAKKGLKEIKLQSPDKLILGYLNISLVRNKFEALTYIIDNNIDLLLISETKLYDSFPTAQFQMKGLSVPYKYDGNGKGGGLPLYECEDIQSKVLISKSKCNIQSLSGTVNLRKRKYFLNCSYNPHQNLISNHLE